MAMYPRALTPRLKPHIKRVWGRWEMTFPCYVRPVMTKNGFGSYRMPYEKYISSIAVGVPVGELIQIQKDYSAKNIGKVG